MVLWFVATAVVTVYFVFGDPRFDYRFLAVGAVLPDLVDVWAGQAWVMHSLTGAVVVLGLVMLATIGRRQRRKQLLGIPIGILLHLVFDGAFAITDVFWWPFSGGFGEHPLPVVARGWWNLPLELIGAVLLVWMARRCGLSEPDRRRRLRELGQLTAAT